MTPTTAMRLICSSTCDPANLPWAAMIQERMNEIVKPNLGIITLPRLGDHELIWANSGKKKPLQIAYHPLKTDQCSILDTRGLFQTFAYPCWEKGEQAKIYGWGFDRHATWYLLEMTRCELSMAETSDGDCVERIDEICIQAMKIEELLAFMKKMLDANDTRDAFRYSDNSPAVIWVQLGKLVAKWHAQCEERYRQSQKSLGLINTEDLFLRAKGC